MTSNIRLLINVIGFIFEKINNYKSAVCVFSGVRDIPKV